MTISYISETQKPSSMNREGGYIIVGCLVTISTLYVILYILLVVVVAVCTVLYECIYVTGTSHPWSWLLPTWSNRRVLLLWWQPSANRTKLRSSPFFFSSQIKGMRRTENSHGKSQNKKKKIKRRRKFFWIFFFFLGDLSIRSLVNSSPAGHGRRQQEPIGKAFRYFIDVSHINDTVT